MFFMIKYKEKNDIFIDNIFIKFGFLIKVSIISKYEYCP